MIPVVSRPSKGKLRHVPGPKYKPSGLVGNIHQHLGTFPGLCIFIGHVVTFYLVPDIKKMAGHRLGNRHFTEACPQLHRHFACILVGPVRGSKARHCHGYDS